MVGQRRSKGGTSLRKFRAGAAGRFSADLDFYAPDDDVTVEVMAMLADAHVDGFGFRIGQLDGDGRRADLEVDTPCGSLTVLIDRLIDSEAEDRIDRLTGHPALGGPELTFLQAQLAHRRGDVSSARALVHKSLQRLPGHRDLLEFAVAIGAALPPLAQQARDRQFGGLHPR